MDKNNLYNSEYSDSAESTEQRIKDYLQRMIPEEIYRDYIEYFIFEKIENGKVLIRYYGEQPLKEFKKDYQETLRIYIGSVIGYVKHFKIYEGGTKAPKIRTSQKTKKHLKAAKLFIISLIFAAITLAVAVIGISYIENHNFREIFYSVSSLKVNNKIRIIQISDLHYSTFGKDNSKLIDRVTKLNPDVIIYTGDCMDSNINSEDAILKLCKALSETAPSFYIYGNNEVDKYYGYPMTQKILDKEFKFTDDTRNPKKLLEIDDGFESKVEKTGVTVLKNKVATITADSTKVDIMGVLTSNPSSFWSYSGDVFDQFITENPGHLKIMAIHEPLIFSEYKTDYWGDLMLCGHTHGGTIRVPLLGPLYTHEGGFFPDRAGLYTYGRYEVSGRPLIVSSGLHRNNLLRINNPPELVVIDINKF